MGHISICAQTFPTSHYLNRLNKVLGSSASNENRPIRRLFQILPTTNISDKLSVIIQLVTRLILILRRRRNSSIIIPNWGGLRLKAILASEWSQLKKKYKEIQKQNMRKLKQSLKVTQQRHLVVHS